MASPRTAQQLITGRRLDELVTEKDFQAAVLEIAHWNRWLTYHTFDSRRSEPGFPDLVLVRAPEAIFAELKTESGKVSATQCRWLEELADCDLEAVIWRPSMLTEIAERLARPR